MRPSFPSSIGNVVAPYAVGKAVPAICGVGLILLLSTELHGTDFGRFVQFVAGLRLGSAIATGAASSALIRFFPRLGTSVAVATALATAICAVSVGVAGAGFFALTANSVSLSVSFPVALLLQSWGGIRSADARARDRPDLYNRLLAYPALLRLVAVAIAILATPRLYLSAVVWIIAAGSFPAVWIHPLRGFHWRPRAIRESFLAVRGHGVMLYAIPIGVISTALAALSAADRFVMEAFMRPELIGRYGLIYAVTEGIVGFISSVIWVGSQPRAFAVYDVDGPDAAAAFISAVARLGGVAIGIVGFVLTATSHLWLGWLLPDRRTEDLTVIAIVGIALAAGFFAEVELMGDYFHMRTDRVAKFTAASAVIALVAVPPLVSWRGLIGAALASLLGYLSLWALPRMTSRKEDHLRALSDRKMRTQGYVLAIGGVALGSGLSAGLIR